MAEPITAVDREATLDLLEQLFSQACVALQAVYHKNTEDSVTDFPRLRHVLEQVALHLVVAGRDVEPSLIRSLKCLT